MKDQRMKWDAEAAFKRIEIRLSLSEARAWDKDHEHDYLLLTEGSLNQLPTKRRKGWTPAPDPRAYMKAKPDVYKGRDYEALTKAAKRKPVGYWEDAPRGAKFGGGVAERPIAEKAQAEQPKPVAGSIPVAPSSDSDLYEPVGTVPVVGDAYVFTDGRGDAVVTFVDVLATCYADRGWAAECQNNGELWTSENTHADKYWYAENGRILKRKPVVAAAPKLAARACASEDGIPGFRKLCVGDKTFYRNSIFGEAWVQWRNYEGTPVPASWPELPANEAQALWRECAAQLKLNPETGEAL